MTRENDSKPIGVRRGITYRTNTSPEDNTPEKIQQRLRTIVELAIAVSAKEGKLRSGLTAEQVRETWGEMDLQEKRSRISDHPDQVEDFDLSEPEQKEIRIRLQHDQWCQIGVEARIMGISHTELARRWILEGLSKRT